MGVCVNYKKYLILAGKSMLEVGIFTLKGLSFLRFELKRKKLLLESFENVILSTYNI